MSGTHSIQTYQEGIHSIIAKVYASEAARLADTNFTAVDIGKISLDTDSSTLHWLQQVTPSINWEEVGNAAQSQLNKVVVTGIKGTAGTINKGQLIYIYAHNSGPEADIQVELAKADSASTLPCIGIANETITNSTPGEVLVLGGVIGGIDTSGTAVGNPIYVSPTTAGAWTTTAPSGPYAVQPVGVIQHVDASDGEIAFAAQAYRPLSDAAPQALGAATQGTSNLASRGDHVHGHGNQAGGSLHADVVAGGASGFMTGTQATKLAGIAANATNSPLSATAPVNVTKNTAAAGSASEASRQDHKHDIDTAAPVAVGLANAEGNATSLARSNHVHAPPTASVATATSGTSTTSTTDVVMSGMTITPAAGTYLAMFSASGNLVDYDDDGWYSIYVGGTQEAHSERHMGNGFSTDMGGNVDFSLHTIAKVTVNGSQAIDVRYRQAGGGTFAINQRSLTLLPVS